MGPQFLEPEGGRAWDLGFLGPKKEGTGGLDSWVYESEERG